MDKLTHGLINRVIDENGVTDKYGEHDKLDFDNDFVPLEQIDYEIHASQSGINKNKEDEMKGTRKEASYIDQLSSGFDATVQNDYDAGKGDKGQIGKGKTEEVAKKNNWGSDKRDAVGRAASASLRRTAAKLIKMADAMDAGEEVEDDVEDIDVEAATACNASDDADIDADDVDADVEISDEDEMEIEAATKKEAAHPMEHKKTVDDPDAEMPSDTGDEWIDIGPGEFDDKRDDVGKAA